MNFQSGGSSSSTAPAVVSAAVAVPAMATNFGHGPTVIKLADHFLSGSGIDMQQTGKGQPERSVDKAAMPVTWGALSMKRLMLLMGLLVL